ncbi:hypothetical protein MML48_4g00006902 [Holotrichia oblita]|uniref:Uncharacterized protein n=3 Tax=Holotrichia oblita TaxID=644536 RepID=A0ACB9T8Y4_HOLOL|nr:hypothetical protein MML48_10g00018618 [Holotrichia oblita]KAI4455661.1 hypothetical protein MML48_9g00000117 [Holotrichia oblita]KAI4463150.1 hypothetical protein MML48_4g00006902 [Holotrichia oblita]
MSWDIIVWEKENAIDYVPSVWGNLKNTMYKYPLGMSQQKTRQIIYDCKDISSNYKWYGAKVKRYGIKSLKKAQELCSRGEYSSMSENTDDDDDDEEMSPHGQKKRSSIIENTEFKIPEVPKIRHYARHIDIQDDPNSEGNRHELLAETNRNNASLLMEQNTDKKRYNLPVSNNEDEINVTEASAVASSAEEYEHVYSEGTMYSTMFEIFLFDKNIFLAALSVTSSPASTLTNYSNLSSSSDILNEILKNQVEIKYTLKDLSKRLDQVDNFIKYTSKIDTSILEESPLLNKLPCETIADVNVLENFVADNQNFDQLVNFLYLLGGESDSKTIYYIMKKLLTNEVALQYSGIGKKRKLPFCTLHIYKAVIAATRKRHRNVAEEQVRKVVSLYLAQSKARIPK